MVRDRKQILDLFNQAEAYADAVLYAWSNQRHEDLAERSGRSWLASVYWEGEEKVHGFGGVRKAIIHWFRYEGMKFTIGDHKKVNTIMLSADPPTFDVTVAVEGMSGATVDKAALNGIFRVTVRVCYEYGLWTFDPDVFLERMFYSDREQL